MEACVKIDDTIPGIEEGLNAGMWTIGLAISGNEVGLSLKDWNALPDGDKQTRRQRAYDRMRQGGAHYVVVVHPGRLTLEELEEVNRRPVVESRAARTASTSPLTWSAYQVSWELSPPARRRI